MTPEQEAKLPLYAQAAMRILRARLERAERQLDEFRKPLLKKGDARVEYRFANSPPHITIAVEDQEPESDYVYGYSLRVIKTSAGGVAVEVTAPSSYLAFASEGGNTGKIFYLASFASRGLVREAH